jgi:hypothetical protein
VDNVRTKTIKFHGSEVRNAIIHYLSKGTKKPHTEKLVEFNAARSEVSCEAINIQIVADFVTITFYKDERSNQMIRRELVPSQLIQYIWIEDL